MLANTSTHMYTYTYTRVYNIPMTQQRCTWERESSIVYETPLNTSIQQWTLLHVKRSSLVIETFVELIYVYTTSRGMSWPLIILHTQYMAIIITITHEKKKNLLRNHSLAITESILERAVKHYIQQRSNIQRLEYKTQPLYIHCNGSFSLIGYNTAALGRRDRHVYTKKRPFTEAHTHTRDLFVRWEGRRSRAKNSSRPRAFFLSSIINPWMRAKRTEKEVFFFFSCCVYHEIIALCTYLCVWGTTTRGRRFASSLQHRTDLGESIYDWCMGLQYIFISLTRAILQPDVYAWAALFLYGLLKKKFTIQ